MYGLTNHTRINVARNGQHYFAAEVRDVSDAEKVATEIATRFPATEGYTVTATRWESSGRDVPVYTRATKIKAGV